MRLHLTPTQHAQLRAYLFDPQERVALMYINLDDDFGRDARVARTWFLGDADYLRRSPDGVELAEHVRPLLIRTAHESGLAVAEAHAHAWPGHRTRFSPTDLDGLRELGPHMIWRLPGKPYTALVIGPDSFDALQWQPTGSVTTIDALVVGGRPNRPTGLSLDKLTGALPGGRGDR